MEILRDSEIFTQLTLRLKRQRKRNMPPYWHDSKIVQLTESHSLRSAGTKPSARTATKVHAWLQQMSATDVNTFGDWYSTVKWKTVRWTNAKTKKSKINYLYEESRERNTKIHTSKQARQRENQPFSSSREGAERNDPKSGWKWYLSTASSSSSSSWWQSPDKWLQTSIWDEQWICCSHCKVFRLQAMANPLQATASVNTTPTPRTRRTSAHVIFSRVAQDMSHQVNR